LREEIVSFEARARARGAAFGIIAHSWGNVLTHLALLGLPPDIKTQVDVLVSLGSPLGYLADLSRSADRCARQLFGNPVRVAIQRELCQRVPPEFMNLSQYRRVREWVNLYSATDEISKPMPVPPTSRNIALGTVGGLVQDHVQYYDWRYRAGDVLLRKTSGAQGVRDTARKTLDRLAVILLAAASTTDVAQKATPAASHAPADPSIAGGVTDPHGKGVPGIHVYACPIPPGTCGHAETLADGTYEIRVPAGRYRVQFGRTSDGRRPDGFYGRAGFTTDMNSALLVEVRDRRVSGVAVSLPFSSPATAQSSSGAPTGAPDAGRPSQHEIRTRGEVDPATGARLSIGHVKTPYTYLFTPASCKWNWPEMVVVFVEVSPDVRLADRATAETFLNKGRDFALKRCGDRPRTIATATTWVLLYQEPFGEHNWKEAFAVAGTFTSAGSGQPFVLKDIVNKAEIAERQQAREREEQRRREAAAAEATRRQAEEARRQEAQRQAAAAAEVERTRKAERARAAMATCLEQGGRRLRVDRWLSGRALDDFIKVPVTLKGQIVGMSLDKEAGHQMMPVADDVVVLDFGGMGHAVVVTRFPLAEVARDKAGSVSKIAGLARPVALVAGRVLGIRPIELPMLGRTPLATVEYVGVAACEP
jgi:hypothetical protein